ncbi:LysM domain-containing protein [Periweissella cryptocerci]|uniref:LysM domain-containing protein n=1 Tax=Periweissella cryptocerci TaxID=2506420 RepID=A0A4P6YRU4_9LACO|nr:LysM domain-containing protein [Periweissella cryptocerci]
MHDSLKIRTPEFLVSNVPAPSTRLDSLRLLGTTVARLVRLNGIKNPNLIRVGQVIVVS